MPAHLAARQRERIVRYHQTNGASVTATCRRFGISRTTLYRWLARYEPGHPATLARRKESGRRMAPREALFFARTLRLAVEHPSWGCRKLRAGLLQLRENVPGERTIGRWLASIRRCCPICKGADGIHNAGLHALQRDLVMLEIETPARGPRRSTQKRARR